MLTDVKIKISYQDYLVFVQRAEEAGFTQHFQYIETNIIPTHSEKPIPEWFVGYVLSKDFGTQPITLQFDMATIQHGKIVSNLHILLGSVSKEKKINIYAQGTFIYVEITGNSFVPDLFLIDAQHQQKKDAQTLLNPLSIVEVLSKSTQKIDKVDKLAAYQQIESLMEYVLIDQYKPHVTVHRRVGAKKWSQEFLTNLHENLYLESINQNVRLSEIYEGIEFLT